MSGKRVNINMRSKKQRSLKDQRRPKRWLQHHSRSVLAISGIIILLAAVAFVHGMSLQVTNRAYQAQEAELQAQLDAEALRAEEIDELKEYVGTDEYIEEVAKEKLGLVHKNEILFKPE